MKTTTKPCEIVMQAPDNTIELITEKLQEAFSPLHLEIINESHLHAGHAGAKSGKGHYALTIQAPAFTGVSPIARHKMIYQSLGSLMNTHIHALSIKILPTA